MATCYRHPSRETGVSCANCGRPICPDCMTTTPVGMRCPECSRQTTTVKTIRNTVSRPEVTLALIAINVVAFLIEGNITLTGQPTDKVYQEGSLLGQHRRAADARRRARAVVADRHGRLPAREPPAHRLQHVRPLRARADARAGARTRALRRDLRGLAARGLARRAARVSAHADRRARRGRCSAHGRGRRRDARAPDPDHAERRRRPDPDQPRHQLHPPGHLLGRSRRWADRRRACSARAAGGREISRAARSRSRPASLLAAASLAGSIAVAKSTEAESQPSPLAVVEPRQ